MKIIKSTAVFTIILLGFLPFRLWAQGTNSLSNEEIENYKKQVNNLVEYLEETLNFIGNPNSVNKEKEIVIYSSYLKMFKDDKVQIEDDLDEKREVPLRKDVQAYLKDIEFFFRSAQFEFLIADIQHFVNEENMHYFRVSFNRNLKGITVQGDSVQNRKARFMEINLDISSNDLKIVSIYTTKINENEENRQWWISLPVAWKKIFGENRMIQDSIKLSEISYYTDSLIIVFRDRNEEINLVDTALAYDIDLPDERESISNTFSSYDTIFMETKLVVTEIAAILKQQEIDISDNGEIRYLNPLSELTALSHLNCSNTLIGDLFPIRNLNHLEVLDFSETPVEDLTPLMYSATLRELNCSYTLVNDLTPIAGLVNLEVLECEGLKITDLDFIGQFKKLKKIDCSSSRLHIIDPLKNIHTLEYVDLSGTHVTDMSPLELLENLKYLNCENSSLSSLESINSIKNLQVLRISNTQVTTLASLTNVDNLQQLYCDNTKIERDEIIQFMRNNPDILVIFVSDELSLGWKELEEPWKEVIRSLIELGDDPSKEELHKVLKIETLDISGNTSITTLRPIRSLFNLKKLDASAIAATDYFFIGEAIELKELDISNNPIDQIESLQTLIQLQELHIEKTNVSSLESLTDLKNLKMVYADGSGVDENAAYQLIELNPHCVVVYNTQGLRSWWQGIPDAWKTFLTEEYILDSPPSTEDLHRLTYLDSLYVRDKSRISDLTPITEMKALKHLTIIGTQITSLEPLANLQQIEVFQCSQSPVNSLEPLAGLMNLTYVDVENTPITDLDPLSILLNLKYLNFSGTQVKSLKPLSSLTNLEVVKLNNSDIKSLKPLQDLKNLKLIECYNTRIKSKEVDQFKTTHPHCEVVYY